MNDDKKVIGVSWSSDETSFGPFHADGDHYMLAECLALLLPLAAFEGNSDVDSYREMLEKKIRNIDTRDPFRNEKPCESHFHCTYEEDVSSIDLNGDPAGVILGLALFAKAICERDKSDPKELLNLVCGYIHQEVFAKDEDLRNENERLKQFSGTGRQEEESV